MWLRTCSIPPDCDHAPQAEAALCLYCTKTIGREERERTEKKIIKTELLACDFRYVQNCSIVCLEHQMNIHTYVRTYVRI